MFEALHELCIEFRNRGCLSFIALYVKGIKSKYLSLALAKKDEKDEKDEKGEKGEENVRCCEILLYLGVKPEKMTDDALAELVERIDALCKEKGAMRYMHTRTVGPKHPAREAIDPNARVKAALQGRPGTVEGEPVQLSDFS
jgi:hypothetical protein